jgi:hypothetical protein
LDSAAAGDDAGLVPGFFEFLGARLGVGAGASVVVHGALVIGAAETVLGRRTWVPGPPVEPAAPPSRAVAPEAAEADRTREPEPAPPPQPAVESPAVKGDPVDGVFNIPLVFEFKHSGG